MNVIEAIEKRRSVRRYLPDPVPEDVLDRVLNAARLAPSGSNRQPLRLIVVRDQEVKGKLAEQCTFTWRTGETRRQDWIAGAPVVVVACGSERDAAALYHKDDRLWLTSGATIEDEIKSGAVQARSLLLVDLAIALDHLSLAAAAENLGTCWIMSLDEEGVKKTLAIPDDVRAPMMMTLGYPEDWPAAKARKPLEEIVSYDRHGK